MAYKVKPPKKVPSRYNSDAYLPDYSVIESRYRQDPSSVVALGRKAFASGDYSAALRYFEAVLKMEPTHKLANYFRKKTIYKMKMYKIYHEAEAEDRSESEMEDDPRPSGPAPAERETRPLSEKSAELPDIEGMANCPDCLGTGKCSRCHGSGLCPNCTGTGWLDLLGKKCGMCGATGECDRCGSSKLCVTCSGSGTKEAEVAQN